MSDDAREALELVRQLLGWTPTPTPTRTARGEVVVFNPRNITERDTVNTHPSNNEDHHEKQ